MIITKKIYKWRPFLLQSGLAKAGPAGPALALVCVERLGKGLPYLVV